MKFINFVAIGLMAFCMFIVSGITLADDSMVLFLSFDEVSGNTIKDSSNYKNDGAIKGKPKLVDGKYGKGIQFEAEGDFVEVQSSKSLNINDEITLMAWGKNDAWKGAGDTWIDKGTGPNKPSCYGIMVFLLNNASTAYLMLADGAARHDLTTPKIADVKGWNHIAGTYDGKTLRLYLNGDLLEEKQDVFKFKGENNLPVVIGAGVERPQYTFEGIIDEVAIFSFDCRRS